MTSSHKSHEPPRGNFCAVCGLRLPSSGHRGRWLCHFCLDAEMKERRGKDDMAPPVEAAPRPVRNPHATEIDYCPYCSSGSIDRRIEYPGSGWLLALLAGLLGWQAYTAYATAAVLHPVDFVPDAAILLTTCFTRTRGYACRQCGRHWRT